MNDEQPKLHIESDWKAEAQAEKERLTEQEQGSSGSGLHVDSDWKAEAQAEKERLARQEQEKAQTREETRGLPKAEFKSLVGVLASQAIMGLGAVADPKSGGVVIDLEGAQFAIDLLAVIEDKTKGNLSDEESKELTQVLSELRARYIQITQALAQQAAMGGVTPGGGTPAPGV